MRGVRNKVLGEVAGPLPPVLMKSALLTRARATAGRGLVGTKTRSE